MRYNAEGPHVDARTDQRSRSLGSRSARLAEASKQLAILLEEVDLDAEPELGGALTDAVVAVDRAADLADEPDGTEPSAWGRLVDDAGEDRGTTRSEDGPEDQLVESGGLQFVGEAGAD